MDTNSIEVQRKHHFVWSWHLMHWSKNERDLYYTTSKGKIRLDSVRGLARESDFYRAKVLTRRQIEIARATVSAAGSGETRNFLSRTLERWVAIQTSFVNGKVPPENAQEFQKIQEALECNFMESLHTAHELLAREAITALLADDLSALSNRTLLLPLCMYTGQAAMRTRPLRDGVARANEAAMAGADSTDLSAAWWFLSFVHGSNLGQSLFHSIDSTPVSLLTAGADCPFIISDHPVVNMCPDGQEALDLVMPLSPVRAIAFSESGRYQPGLRQLSCEEVEAINRTIAERSATVFACSEARAKHYSQYLRRL